MLNHGLLLAVRAALRYRAEVTNSILDEPQPRTRPAGVRVIAIVCFVLAAYLVVNAALIVGGVVSLASGAYIVGEFSTMGPVLYFLVASVLFGLGFALLKGWSLARRVAIIVAALLLATAVMPVSAAVIYGNIPAMIIYGAKIIAAIIAVRFLLLSDVVDYFNARTSR
jgi:hypothetical protein